MIYTNIPSVINNFKLFFKKGSRKYLQITCPKEIVSIVK